MSPLSSLKTQTLKANGTFNPHAQRVRDPLFQEQAFFDPHDRLQVKYEMLRRVRVDGWTVARAAAVFGFSRLSFYHIQRAFAHHGLSGLVGRQRGPKRGYKLTPAVIEAIQAWRAEEPPVSTQTLVERVAQRFQVSVHPRSIERTLARRPQKGGTTR
jgi:transposase